MIPCTFFAFITRLFTLYYVLNISVVTTVTKQRSLCGNLCISELWFELGEFLFIYA